MWPCRPQCLEIDDGGRARFGKIADLIGQCRYGIHDISRTDTSSAGGLPRFNMPLGIAPCPSGPCATAAMRNATNDAAVMDSDRTRYRDFISDLSGHDIKAHANAPAQAIAAVRDFLRSASGMRLPGGVAVAALYARFTTDLPEILRQAKIEPDEMTFTDTTAIIFEWLKQQSPPTGR